MNRAGVHALTFRLAGHQDATEKYDFNVQADSQDVSVTLNPVKAAPVADPPRPSRPSRPGREKDNKDKEDIEIFE